MTHVVRGLLVATAAVLALCSCAGSSQSPTIDEDIAVVDIAELPDIDETRARMTELIERAGSEVSLLVPDAAPWEWRGEVTTAPCTQAATGSKGSAAYLPRFVSQSRLTDAQWQQVLPVVQSLADSAGLTRMSPPQGDGASRDVRFTSEDGRELVFLSRATTVLSATIVCRRHSTGEG